MSGETMLLATAALIGWGVALVGLGSLFTAIQRRLS